MPEQWHDSDNKHEGQLISWLTLKIINAKTFRTTNKVIPKFQYYHAKWKGSVANCLIISS
jgi:hypothetical protein